MVNKEKVRQIIRQFRIQGDCKSFEPHGGGHINETFRVINSNPTYPDYLLQKINHQVFKHVDQLMENMQRVLDHLHSQNKENNGVKSLVLVPSNSKKFYFQDSEGGFWRMFEFVEDSKVFETISSPTIAYEGGKMFGEFLIHLSDLSPDLFYEVIPDFHNIHFRFKNLFDAEQKDTEGRVGEVQQELNFIKERIEIMGTFQELNKKNLLPKRVTHNDTKLNNVLFDQNNHGLCVIDLDTVMPGFVHYDFGDAIRTCANTAPEDEPDLSKINVSLPMFEAFARGYLEKTKQILTPTEIQYLPLSGAFMAFIMGVRFLTDYLMGDVYYKTNFPGQNLQRAKSQLMLTKKIEENYDSMHRIIQEILED